MVFAGMSARRPLLWNCITSFKAFFLFLLSILFGGLVSGQTKKNLSCLTAFLLRVLDRATS